MTDNIRRYECLLPKDTGCGFGEWVRYKDHLKAMEAKDKTIEAQAKEIEWLKGEEDKFKTLLMHIENYYPEEYESLMGMLPC